LAVLAVAGLFQILPILVFQAVQVFLIQEHQLHLRCYLAPLHLEHLAMVEVAVATIQQQVMLQVLTEAQVYQVVVEVRVKLLLPQIILQVVLEVEV
jgi:hypothetical protein